MINLFDYQKEALEFHLKNKYSICALSLGLGKTLVGLALVEKLQLKTLVVAPAFLVRNWQDEIKKYCPELKDLITVYPCSQLNKLADKLEYEIMIIDEFHFYKNRKAERTKKLFSIVKKTKPKYFLGLSGTPAKNYIYEFWMLLKIIHLGGLKSFDGYASSFWRFALRFCASSERFIYGRKVVEFGGAQNVDELKDILKDCMIRKKASEVLSLPESITKDFIINDKGKVDKELARAYEIYDSGKVIGEESFTETKTINALSKVSFTCDLAKEILEEESHIIIFTDHIDSCYEISKELNGTAITGKIPVSRRMDLINEWKQNGGALVGTYGAMGTGLNLIEARFMILNDFPWVGSDLLQSLKRIMRIGQKSTCYYYFVFSSPVDHYIYEKVIAKSAAIKKVLS